MKWLTQDYIQAQAKKGRRPALECSIEHWEQLAGATYRELVFGGSLGSGDCALCYRYSSWSSKEWRVGSGCRFCPLDKAGENCFRASSAFCTVREVGFGRIKSFHREAKKMLKVLKDVHKKLYGRKK